MRKGIVGEEGDCGSGRGLWVRKGILGEEGDCG